MTMETPLPTPALTADPAAPAAPMAPLKAPRKYSGPPKGSQEAKDRMAVVRQALYKKHAVQ